MTTDLETRWIAGGYDDRELSALTQLPESTMRRLVTEGAIRPMAEKTGRGHKRRWGAYAVRRLAVIAALLQAGLPRRVAAKVSYALRHESQLLWGVPAEELGERPDRGTAFFIEVVDGELVFQRQVWRGQDQQAPLFLGRVADGAEFAPAWDWRKEENWTPSRNGAFYYPKWQEPFVKEDGTIASWTVAEQPRGYAVDEMREEARKYGRFFVEDRRNPGQFIFAQQVVSDDFLAFEVDTSLTDEAAAERYARFATKLTINVSDPLRRAARLSRSADLFSPLGDNAK